jgi:ferric-dicitrate binding protein FerR (iron transport regulator)
MEKNRHQPSQEIIERVLNDLASQEEATWVSEWFRTSDGQCSLAQSMDRDFSDIKENLEEVTTGHSIPSDALYRRMMNHIRRYRVRRLLFRAAAVLLPFLLVGGLFFHLNTRVQLFGEVDYEEVSIPKGERVQFLFQDGSKAYINAESSIRYPKQFGLAERKIFLEGEAYFVVQPNANRPFVVEMERTSIKVLGTSFNVQAYPEDPYINVALDEGKVNLISWNKKDHFLHSGEKLIYEKATDNCTIIKAPAGMQPASLWKDDVIAFRNASLQEVIKTLSRWYNVSFVVEDRQTDEYFYTITEEHTLLEKVLRDLEKISPVRFIYDEETKLVRVTRPEPNQ